jgi:hypothetical protein
MTEEMDVNESAVDSGVKVVGATPAESETAPEGPPTGGGRRSRADTEPGPSRRTLRIVSVVAALGLAGTLLFGVLYATDGGSSSGGNPAVLTTARTFLTEFFNFDAKSVDADFNAVTNMATGAFSNQAKQFFNTSIRSALEKALAESRGQIRALYVQSETATTATVYAVVDQTYVNNKFNSPQADVVRLVVDLQLVGSTWKISNVTVLEGATPASAGSASGSAGSSVPGQ